MVNHFWRNHFKYCNIDCIDNQIIFKDCQLLKPIGKHDIFECIEEIIVYYDNVYESNILKLYNHKTDSYEYYIFNVNINIVGKIVEN